MKDWKKKLQGSLTDEEIKRYLRFLVIPFVIIILIIVIVISDQPNEAVSADVTNQLQSGETSSEGDLSMDPAADGSSESDLSSGDSLASSETLEPDNSQYVQDFSAYELQKDAVPEINALLESYVTAKKSCDVEALNRVFGNSYTGDLEAERAKLQAEATIYDHFQNITSYTKPGLTPDTYVVFGRFDIKFRGADTPAPALIVCYAQKSADGNYYFSYQNSEEVNSYIKKVSETEDVQLLSSQINSQLKAALESDENLYIIYKTLRETPAAEETNAEESSETAAGETTSAASETTETSPGASAESSTPAAETTTTAAPQ